MPEHADTLARWLRESRTTVAFTGAGISTESGIPDYRSPGGIWAQSQPVYFSAFLDSAAARHEYWRQKSVSHRDFAAARPNAGHLALAKWEVEGRLQALVTQNIDGLHQDAGSRHVLELHGTARFVGCLSCEERFEAGPMVEAFLEKGAPPDCPRCRGLLKHATVSFGQSLPEDVLQEAIDWSRKADLLLAIGSSLVVTPAALLPMMAKEQGARLVIINRTETPLDGDADLVIRDGIGDTLSAVE